MTLLYYYIVSEQDKFHLLNDFQMKRIVIRKILFSFTMLFCSLSVFPQEYNADLNALGQYVQRMYLNEPFEGVRVIEDYDNCFLIVITEE